ncbi:uncharacterized protein LOC106090471 isoform X3 [Stomoxys calcitrans]|uniref:uncharacterized protein LOC106090471 isoform X3 n=1 Tax=Stomoxys calcitrans TaxID=35570 RepID=UPI0027E258A4|nr:uncharacterized protein LOC106090471 isoform X3 [Stomoxys calcitrans]
MSLKRLNAMHLKDTKNYNLYCINFHGNGLKSVKYAFKNKVKSGLRRSVFILDLDDLKQHLNNQPRSSKRKSHIKDDSGNQLMMAVMKAIHNFMNDFDVVNKKINEELMFDIYQYWLRDLEEKQATPFTGNSKSLRDKNYLNPTESKSVKSKKAPKKSREKDAEESDCITMIVKEHNSVGQTEKLSKRKYIEDDPPGDNLFIVIIGQITEDFYLDLLREQQPIQGIIHFLPAESNYDILLNNYKQRDVVIETLRAVNASIYESRQIDAMKSVGIFTHHLNVISKCLAAKHQREIYDQLTWSVYDIEVLHQQYQTYYLRPFQEINVTMSEQVDLTELCHLLESSVMQQRYSTASSSDWATIAAYMDNLFKICVQPHKEKVGDFNEQPLLKITQANNSFEGFFTSPLESVMTVKNFNRLFIEETNELLNNLLVNTNLPQKENIYDSYMDYNLWKNYFTETYRDELEDHTSSSLFFGHLPRYVKLYLSQDGCKQRINKLLQSYDDYQVYCTEKNNKIYAFRRTLYKVYEDERLIVIPSRLCFRDFVLFQREEFLENLVTPVMHKISKEERKRTSLSKRDVESEIKTLQMEEQIFVRPKSLKALKIFEEKSCELSQTQETHDRDIRSSRQSSRQYNKKLSASRNSRQPQDWVGIPPDHHLLKGYNLPDTRQEIKLKTSKYFFENGFLKLYEEKWCFQDMNKNLTFAFDECSLFFNDSASSKKGISKNILVETKNKINIRILNELQESSKIVMNYPNGLTVYYQDMKCEQIWQEGQCFKEEKRRIFTHNGAVIVFFGNDLILIMRYNGEVYKLYQYEFVSEEEDLDSLNKISDSQSFECNETHKLCKKHKPKTAFNQHTKRISSKLSTDIHMSACYSFSSMEANLLAVIGNELKFLRNLMKWYKLSYIHLVLTTTQGRQFHLTKDGNIFEDTPLQLEEWHDYYANESYAQRSDGVKMIWTNDVLTCYHNDGTVLITRTEEKLEVVNWNEFDMQISQSSSHVCSEEDSDLVIKKETFLTIHEPNTKMANPFAHAYWESPEELKYDDTFVCYASSNWLMQHHDYAGVIIRCRKPFSSCCSSIFMDIMGLDDIYIYTMAALQHKLVSSDETRQTCDISSPDNDIEEVGSVNVCVGSNLHMAFDGEDCEISFLKDGGTNSYSDTLWVYCKIPPLLQNIQDIDKFLEPFKNVNFKNLRHKIKELLDIYLRPQIKQEAMRLYSSNIWQKRHEYHKQRKLQALQRTGLYQAMLKYSVYPNYFKFMRDYKGHVCNIDFFQFVALKCKNDEVKAEETGWKMKNNSIV